MIENIDWYKYILVVDGSAAEADEICTLKENVKFCECPLIWVFISFSVYFSDIK